MWPELCVAHGIAHRNYNKWTSSCADPTLYVCVPPIIPISWCWCSFRPYAHIYLRIWLLVVSTRNPPVHNTCRKQGVYLFMYFKLSRECIVLCTMTCSLNAMENIMKKEQRGIGANTLHIFNISRWTPTNPTTLSNYPQQHTYALGGSHNYSLNAISSKHTHFPIKECASCAYFMHVYI